MPPSPIGPSLVVPVQSGRWGTHRTSRNTFREKQLIPTTSQTRARARVRTLATPRWAAVAPSGVSHLGEGGRVVSPKRVVLCHPGTFVFSVFAPSAVTVRIGWLRLRWPFYFYFSGSSCPTGHKQSNSPSRWMISIPVPFVTDDDDDGGMINGSMVLGFRWIAAARSVDYGLVKHELKLRCD